MMKDATMAEALLALLHPVFRDCLDAERFRKDTGTPWVDGEFVYATDGRICVKSAATPEVVEAYAALPVDPGKPRLENPGRVFEGTDFLLGLFALPSVWLGRCTRCRGAGVQPAYECGDCGCEEAERVCRRCLGFGRGDGYSAGVPLDGPGSPRVSHHVMNVTLKHAAAVHRHDPLDHTKPFRFTLPGVEGRFMLMQPADPGEAD